MTVPHQTHQFCPPVVVVLALIPGGGWWLVARAGHSDLHSKPHQVISMVSEGVSDQGATTVSTKAGLDSDLSEESILIWKLGGNSDM